MQNKNTERKQMSKIRMNTEFRNKILNRYVESTETETTQEQQSFLQARENVDKIYPQEDVITCQSLKQKYGSPLDVVAKDKCFYFFPYLFHFIHTLLYNPLTFKSQYLINIFLTIAIGFPLLAYFGIKAQAYRT